jgi:Tol biopolymer transport system component
MTTDRADRTIASWLADSAQPRLPDYFDDLMTQAARTRQRPAWTFPGRWFPMAVLTRTPQFVSPVPVRLVLVLAMVAALAAIALLAGGPSPSRDLPPPFGLAANGRIMLNTKGDIVTVDPTTGQRTVVVGGPDLDGSSSYSRDGTRIVFARDIDGPFMPESHLFVVDQDGTGVTQITREPFVEIKSMEFSPDGRSVVVVAENFISIVASDGGGTSRFNLGMAAERVTFRPDGQVIAFARIDAPAGLYLVNIDGTQVRPVVTIPDRFELDFPRWSPDGRWLTYTTWDGEDLSVTARVHIVAADGTGDRIIGSADRSVWESGAAWSNAGDRLAMMRGYGTDWADARVIAASIADGTIVESAVPLASRTGCCWVIEWAPDDSAVLITPRDPAGNPLTPMLMTPQTGRLEPVPGGEPGWASWQRVLATES